MGGERPPDTVRVPSLSPEARRRKRDALKDGLQEKIGPGTRIYEVARRTIAGAWNDGFIHAGNLAYLSMLSIFPFFILGAAIFSAIGEESERLALVEALLAALPPVVSNVIDPVARNVVEARSGSLLWIGGAVGLWTASGLVETIRDILRRAYGTEATLAFWRSRLLSVGLILASVIVLILSLIAQFVIGAAQQVIAAYIPWFMQAMNELSLSRIIPAVGLFGSIFMLFVTLTPVEYRGRRYPKWPGAALVTLWWIAVAVALPKILSNFFTYDLTYGSLAGIMVTLFFFWLVGLGMVIGAEFNAALANPHDESNSEISESVEVQKDETR